jgi:ABC-type antimicrobial peptide transport system permease subunit
MFLFQPSWSWQYTMRLAPTVSTSTALAKLKTISEKYSPDHPFTYSFVDEAYTSKFATEMLIGRLAGYYYRITISPLVFLAAAILALVITAITVGFQSVRSAMQNPVTALRSE